MNIEAQAAVRVVPALQRKIKMTNYDKLLEFNLDEIKDFVRLFKKQYKGNDVPPIVFTAFQLAGEDTSILNVDPYYKK